MAPRKPLSRFPEGITWLPRCPRGRQRSRGLAESQEMIGGPSVAATLRMCACARFLRASPPPQRHATADDRDIYGARETLPGAIGYSFIPESVDNRTRGYGWHRHMVVEWREFT